jgi:hypothetical protein
VVGFQDFQIPRVQCGGGLAHEPGQHGDAETEIGRLQHRDVRGGSRQPRLLRGIEAGGAGHQRRMPREALLDERRQGRRCTEIDDHVERADRGPVAVVAKSGMVTGRRADTAGIGRHQRAGQGKAGIVLEEAEQGPTHAAGSSVECDPQRSVHGFDQRRQ